MRTLETLVLASAVALAPAAASAIPVTFIFTGSVTDDPFGVSHFGAPISGAFSFDSSAIDAIANPATGSYSSSGAAYRFDADVDGTAYAVAGSTTINTANNIAGFDQYGVIATAGGLTLELFLQDSTGTALASDALPVQPPTLATFSFRQFRLFSDDAQFLGDVTSLACTSGCVVLRVPEPAPLLLLATGALLSIVRTRRSRRQADR